MNESVLSKPFEMCTNFRQEEGHPFIVTETAWKNPHRYQSEGPFLVAAYQSLNRLDGVAWFSCQTPGHETDSLKRFWFATHKWNHCYPAMMAGFPANALLDRRGDLQQADPVVRDIRTRDDIFGRRPPRIDDNEAYGDQRNLPDLAPGWRGRPGDGDRFGVTRMRLQELDGEAPYFVATLPLSEFLRAGIDTGMVHRILQGDLLIGDDEADRIAFQ